MSIHCELAVTWARKHSKTIASTLIAFSVIGYKVATALFPAPAIKLYIGEPWEEMQKNSTASISSPADMLIGYESPNDSSSMNFDDSKFKFDTPQARFFVIFFDKEKKVHGVRISPTMNTMTLDESLTLIDNLQTQWRNNGWFLTDPEEFPALDRSNDLMERYKACLPVSTYWQAEHKYQIIVAFSCFGSKDLFGQQQYMVTLGIGKPWVQTPAEMDQQDREREAKAKREGRVYVPLPR